MDPIKDAHLLYIAKEGLKSPLPEPWKPCQSKDGEIFYYNFETKQSTFEHPCDNYYRSLYQKEKKRSSSKPNSHKELEIFDDNKKGKMNIPPIKQISSPMFGKSKNEFPIQESHLINELTLKQPILMDKSKDPLILSQKNKKIEAYKEKKIKEFEDIKASLDNEYESKLSNAKRAHQSSLKELETQFQNKLKAEQSFYNNEIQSLETSMKSSRNMPDSLEEKIKKELSEQNQRKIEEEIYHLEEDFKQFQKDSEKSAAIILEEEMEKIKKKYKSRIDELEKEIEGYEQKTSASEEFDEEAFLSEHRNNIRKEYEKKFAQEKEIFLQKIELEYQDEINKEMENHNLRLQDIEKKAQEYEENIRKINEEDFEYKKFLEEDFEKKMKILKDENARKFEIEKLVILEKMRDIEQEKKMMVRKEVQDSIINQRNNFVQEKKEMEEKFEEKIRTLKESQNENPMEDSKEENKINKIHEDLLSLKQSLINSRHDIKETDENNKDITTLSQVNDEIRNLMNKKNELLEKTKNKQLKMSSEEKKVVLEKLRKINEKLELMIKVEGIMQSQLLE